MRGRRGTEARREEAEMMKITRKIIWEGEREGKMWMCVMTAAAAARGLRLRRKVRVA